MVRSTRSQRSNRSPLSSVLTLTWWRWRQTRFLLSIIALGMVASVIIACSIPLFTDIMTTAGLRNTLRATSDSSEIEAHASTVGISSAVIKTVQSDFDSILKPALGSLIQTPGFEISSADFSFAPSTGVSSATVQSSLVMRGADLTQAAAHLSDLKGHIASSSSSQPLSLDVMMTPTTAKSLHLAVGSTFPLLLSYLTGPITGQFFRGDAPVKQPQEKVAKVTARVAGLFDISTANASYWHGSNFQPLSANSGKAVLYTYSILASNSSLIALFDSLQPQTKAGAIFAASGAYNLIWYCHIDPSQVVIGKLDALLNDLANAQNQFQANYSDGTSLQEGSSSAPYLEDMALTSTLFSSADTPSTLVSFQSRIAVAQIPIAVLGIMIMVLILFFVSLMTGLLVERQNDAIALLRSRGASSGQIFWALMTQSIGLGIVALALGIPLSLLAVYTLSKRILPAGSQDALNVLTGDVNSVILTGIIYAFSIVLIVLLTMGISIFTASRSDVLALRRQSSSRTQRRPLWQRLNLDILAGIIALAGYGVSFYLTSLGNVLQGDAQTLIATPLSIIAPFFLIIGSMFLFLRIFPLLLAFIASLVVRGRGAVSMLALAQIGRSPKQAIRMALLLALAVAFALFTLVYTASQTQHIQDISVYEVGADFGGQYTQSSTQQDVTKINNLYAHIPGVISASSGYVAQASGGKGGITMNVRAVDTSTFASTVIWPSEQESKVGTKLLAQETQQRKVAIERGLIPAIIDTHTANQLYLHVGSPLTVHMTGLDVPDMDTIVIGIIPHVPTVNDRIGIGGKNSVIPGSILIDYPTYKTIYNTALQKMKVPPLFADTPPINYVWLHTNADAGSLASVRLALKQPTRSLQNLADRWSILASLHSDPLYLILSGLLIIGTITALLLAFVGDLLASWLSARIRLTNFAVLRAIGTTPREVASMLTWEQGIVYVTGLLLGIGFGALLSITVIPALSLTDINSTLATGDQFYALQTAFPTRIVIPATLLWGLVIVVALYCIALTMMVRIVSAPTMSQTLRLNED